MPQPDLMPPMPQSDFMNMMKQALREAMDPQLAEIKNEVSATRHDIRQMSSRIDTIEHKLEDYDELRAEVKGLREEVSST
jgi:predicted  nucleic acid-binding Zn-ribbon protein